MKLSVTGKGGVGKTSISAHLALAWAREGLNVYAVDADPDANLGWALGFDDEELAQITPLSQLEDLIEERAGKGAFFVLNPKVDDVIHRYAGERHGVKLLRMGALKPGGSGCYCPENAFLRSVVGTLLADPGDAVILDMGAGIEHLTRGTTRHVDLMLTVVEPTRAGVGTARTVERLARELGVGDIRVVANKVADETDRRFVDSEFPDGVMAYLPYDPGFRRYDANAGHYEGPLGEAIRDLARRLLAEGTTI